MKIIFYILLYIVLTLSVFFNKITEDGAFLIFIAFFIIPFLTKVYSKKDKNIW